MRGYTAPILTYAQLHTSAHSICSWTTHWAHSMRGYACIVCVDMRKVCVCIYALSMHAYICAKYACVYMRKVCVHIYARIVCTYFAHMCAHTLRIYARIFNFFWRILTHTWRTDTASMRAYLVCVETLSRTLLKTKINYEYC